MTTLAATSTTVVASNDELNDLAAFVPSEDLAGQRCGALTTSNGSVQVDATASLLAPVTQQSTQVASSDLRLSVHFGSGFPGHQCTDLSSEVRNPVVATSWPATATAATFTVIPSLQCSAATLQLEGVVATSPAGDQVHLGNIRITNQAWQWWPPFECHVDLDRARAVDDTASLTRGGVCGESLLWAADEADRVAVLVRVPVSEDDAEHVYDLAASPEQASVQILRGPAVTATICTNDFTDETGTSAVAGLITVSFAQTTGGPCLRSGSITLQRVYFDDESLLDIHGMPPMEIGCT
ncbi:MAG: hypothetical protein ABIR32_01370 [Ilumatobacteraceae bacterium]